MLVQFFAGPKGSKEAEEVIIEKELNTLPIVGDILIHTDINGGEKEFVVHGINWQHYAKHNDFIVQVFLNWTRR
jgi:hypothetical protein